MALGIGPLQPYVNAKLGDIFVAPALGGPAAKLVDDGYYPAWSWDGRQVAFTSPREGQWHIWVIPSEGGTPKRLTQGPDFDYQPAWSPDGKWIAYGSGRLASGAFSLKVVAAVGGQPATLTKDFGYVTRPAWAADGASIFFSGERNGILNVWRIPSSPAAAPAEPVRVTLGQGQDSSLSASRDGKRLAFATGRNEPNVWELTLATGALRAVTSGAGASDFPELSPDGRTLILQSRRSGNPAVWSVDLQGRFLSQLTASQSSEPSAHWSPDGKQIAYLRGGGRLVLQSIGSMSVRDTGIGDVSMLAWSPDGKTIAIGHLANHAEIGLYSLAEQKLKVIVALERDCDNPTWSPDGKRIAFQTQRGEIRELWVVPSEGGTPTQLTKGSEDSHPAWSPRDPDQIVFLRDHKRLGLLSVSTGKLRFPPGYSEGSFILDYPSWSPDGTRVYFSVARKSADIYVLEGF